MAWVKTCLSHIWLAFYIELCDGMSQGMLEFEIGLCSPKSSVTLRRKMTKLSLRVKFLATFTKVPATLLF